MERAVSTPLEELPTFLSSISMVVDDRASIINSLTQAERKSPPKYGPARDLFRRILQGDLSFADALRQAHNVVDPTHRACAVDVLEASSRFLRSETPARVGEFPTMDFSISTDMTLVVAPVWLRHLNPHRLMALHFWRKPLTARQLGAAAAVLRTALLLHHPEYVGCGLDFISVSHHEGTSGRQFQRYDWASLKPLDEVQLRRFWRQFCEAWSEYQKRAPRTFTRRHQPGFL
jgi:hypothetical protein